MLRQVAVVFAGGFRQSDPQGDGEDCGLVLEISVEMGKMVSRSSFGEHADYDSKEAAQFRHRP